MALAENPTLKAAVDTYYTERGNEHELGQLRSTIKTELTKLQQIMAVPALSVTDVRGIVLASAGPNKGDWPAGDRVSLRVAENGEPVETIVSRNGHPYSATAVPLVLGRDVVGEFFLASPLDDAYALNLAGEARADIAILLDGRVIASSTPAPLRHALEGVALPLSGTIVPGGDEFVVQRLSSVDAATLRAGVGHRRSQGCEFGNRSGAAARGRGRPPHRCWRRLVSWRKLLPRPIDRLSNSLARMAKARDFAPLPRTGEAANSIR